MVDWAIVLNLLKTQKDNIMENNVEYYFIAGTGMSDVPLLRNNDEINPRALRFLSRQEAVEIGEPVYLCYNSPIPKEPRMVDYHSLPSSVFSQKIIDVLTTMGIEGTQFVPAIVSGLNGEEYRDYYIVHCYARKEVFDKERSVYEYDEDDGYWDDIEKLFLDVDLLSKIPLSQRLIFKPKETTRFELYHQSVVDAIMAVNPEGVQFIPVDGWYEGIQFEVN